MDDLTRHFISTSKSLRYLINKEENEQSRQRQESESNPGQMGAICIEAPMDASETAGGKNKSNQDIEDTLRNLKQRFLERLHDDPKFILEIAGFLVLTIYAAFTIAMYFANQKSADAAKTAADIAAQSQRPIMWLSTNNGEPDIFKSPRKADEGQITWTWHYTNYGKTPPENVRYRQYFKIGNLEPIRSFGEQEDSVGPPTPPGKDEMSTVITDPMPIAAINDSINQGWVRIIVIMTYSDVTHAHYESGFCLWRTNAGSIAYCTEGNYIK